MARLIDADALMEQVKAIHNAVDASQINQAYNTGFHSATSQMQGLIAYMPTIDAKPVVHGEWKPKKHKLFGNTYEYICSCCGCDYALAEYYFCPHCGADMRGGQ